MWMGSVVIKEGPTVDDDLSRSSRESTVKVGGGEDR